MQSINLYIYSYVVPLPVLTLRMTLPTIQEMLCNPEVI